MDITTYIQNMGRAARQASSSMATATSDTKNAALTRIGEQLDAHRDKLLTANQRDLDAGARGGGGRPTL